MKKLDSFFKISERGSNVKTEIIAGLTTFFAMAYIVVTNPNQVVGFMNFDQFVADEFAPIWNSVYVASILVAVIGTLLYAFYAKLPFAQACGMGLNSFFFVSFIIPSIIFDPITGAPIGTNGTEISMYQQGLCIILLSGVLFLILSVTGLRKYIATSLPDCLKKAIPAGIGLFIAFIGFKNVGIIQTNQYTFVQFFDFHGIIDAVGMNLAQMAEASVTPAVYGAYENYFGAGNIDIIATAMDAWRIIAPVVLALLGFFTIAVLDKFKVKGSVIITIAGVTVLYYLTTWTLPSFDIGMIGRSFVDFGKYGFLGAFKGFGIFSGGVSNVINAIVLVITFTLVDMFDTIGTLYGTASQANMLDENGDPINIDKSMTSDSVATLTGAALGTSTCTTFVESAAGVAAGGRTGLASIVTAICFAACLFLTPLAAIVPACATAPALIYVGVLMLKNFAKVDMSDITAAVPAFLALIMMPLTYSISNGIAIGSIAYVVIRLCTGKYTKKDIVVTCIAVLFTLRFFLVSM